eukprot:g12272.t1
MSGMQISYDGRNFTPDEKFLRHMRNPEGPVMFEIIAEVGDKIYGQVNGIPVTLSRTSDKHRWDVAPSQTKQWNLSAEKTYADVTSDGVWEFYPSLNFEFMSTKFWEILGYDQNEMKESPESWLGMLHESDKPLVANMYDEHVKSKGEVPYSATVKYKHRDDKVRHILCRGIVTDWMPDGTPWRMIGTHTDVTLHVQEEALIAKSRFVARMSHEIRTPLVAILGECELDVVDRTVVKHSCEQLLRITDDILELNKMETKQELRLEHIDLFDHLQRCIKRHEKHASEKSIKVRLMMGSIPRKVEMDAVRFNQVIDNLVTNAMKYSGTGTKITLDVEFHEGNSQLQVRVVDQGGGIPQGITDTLFDEFVQGDSTMKGAGIGLSICRNLSRTMGGDVVVEKTSPDGTTMLFTSQAKELPVDTLVDGEISIGKVMVVDDMKTNRALLKGRLKKITAFDQEKLSIAEACNGQEAVDLFREDAEAFDLILMDCLMPVVDGFSATIMIHKMCNEMGLEPVPVVAVTASVSPDIQSKCYESGMSSIVTKPYTVFDLTDSIKSTQHAQMKRGKSDAAAHATTVS